MKLNYDIFYGFLILKAFYFHTIFMEDSKSDPVRCYSDTMCSTFNDCCKTNSILYDSDMHSSQVRPQNELFKNRVWTCGSINNDFLNVYIVDKCPSSDAVSTPQENRCGLKSAYDIESNIPVISNDNIIYQNKYCAQCHFIHHMKHLPATQLACNDEFSHIVENSTLTKSNIIHFLRKGWCRLNFNLSTIMPRLRRCYPNMIDECPPDDSGNWTNIYQCSNQPAMWVQSSLNSKFYRNPSCCNCWQDTCKPTDAWPMLFKGRIPHLPGFVYLELSGNYIDWLGNHTKIIDENQHTLTEIFTTINSLFSTICLIILVIIYGCIPQLRTFHGYMTLAFCSSLIGSYVCFYLALLFSYNSTLCTVIGNLRYFFIWSSFLWMTLFATELVKTFGQNLPTNRSINTRFFTFACVGFGIPGLFTFISLLVQWTTPATFLIHPNYGLQICWFIGKPALYIWFVAPLSLVVLLNFILCIVVITFLRQTYQNTRAVHDRPENQQQQSRSFFLTSLKVTVIVGGTWFLQIISDWVFVGFPQIGEVIRQINLLQGALVTLCFLGGKVTRKRISSHFLTCNSSTTPSTAEIRL